MINFSKKKYCIIKKGALWILVFSTLSCTHNKIKSKVGQGIPLAEPISIIQSLDKLAEYIAGDIEIRTNTMGDIICLVNGKNHSNARLYILQGGHFNIDETIEKGEVIYLFHSLLINSLDKKERYYFYVPKPEERAVYRKLPDSYKTFFTDTASGYGVSRMCGLLPEVIGSFKCDSDPYTELNNYRMANFYLKNK